MTERASIAGRTALITGAAKRLGRAIALELAGAGMHVVLHARSSLEEAGKLSVEVEALGVRALVVQADQRNVDAIRAACDTAWERMGPIDLLVNSAAAWPHVPIEQCTQEDYDLALETNLRGPFFWARHLGVRMKQQGCGCIVSLGDAAHSRPPPRSLPYALAKAGIVTLTHGLAKALAPEVRVNAIAPGPVLFPEGYSQESMDRDRRKTLLGREGTPEDIASAVRFLFESPYITGAVLPVDGGFRFGM